MYRTRFEAIGSYTPAEEVSTEELIDRLEIPRNLDLAAITGIQSRRVYNADPADYESSFALATNAIADCLERSDYTAAELDIVISVSITRTTAPGLFAFEPSFSLMLRNSIGAFAAKNFDISNACAGMVTGIMVLDRLIRAGVVKNGIVVSGEQITPIAETAVREIREPYDPQFAALTVGDAAVAVILDGRGDERDAIHYVQVMTASAAAEHCIGMPSDRSNGMAMYTDNRAMQNESRYMQGIVRMKAFLDETHRTWDSENYDFWIHHQFSAPAIEYITHLTAAHFGTTMPEALNVLEDYGNTASTSHFLVLHEHLKNQKIPKGSKILMIPSASGMVYGFLAATVSRLGA
ncbi:3-oxoacyl-ACP synthase III family protein [Antrihabitans cavernicola]|uniref:3-oxoacyl-ACP synthase n=1 Tax=Antrihabitans cavernicola TaxID=2495913 RepID=A0A5A7SBX1_9NOCA|nr:3-oxoacyl-[acyl-carrier-protein] synthase III C-terminal domain-containing protein [Spelaeibacter cavernicola]KAA0023054.1 3-oxoacyl-ACP synthase [Spelaeibacter cavernicola]